MKQRTPVYSYSKLSAFEKCRWQFLQRYGHKRYIDRQGIEAFVGSIVHQIIEDIYAGKLQANQLVCWDRFLMDWDSRYDPKKNFDVREHGPEHWRDHGLKCISNYLRMGHVTDREIIGIEYKLSAPLSLEPMLSFVGYADRIVRNEDGAPEIHDFKTGRVAKKRYFEADMQLPVYAYVVARNFAVPDDVPIKCSRVYLATGEIADIEVDSERRRDAWEWVVRTAIDAQAWLSESMSTGAEADTFPSVLCDWCDYKNEGCPVYKTTDGVL